MKQPLLSICIITYNQERYIRQAIDSVLMQDVSFDWQLIVADDCSTDSTRDILREYKAKYPERVHLILQKKNVGPEANWLDLIDYPKTKYVLYAEGDDYLTDPTKLQRQVDFLETHKDYSMCFHPVKVLHEDNPDIDEIFPVAEQRFHKKTLGMNDLLKANFIQTNSVMYRWRFTRESVKDIYPRGVAPGDWFLHLLHADQGKIGFMDRVMAVYRRHREGIWWESSHNVDEIWKKYGIAHLRFYNEALRMYGTTPARRAIISPAVHTMLDTFVRVDAQYGSQLVAQAIAQFPVLIVDYAAHKTAQLQKAEAQLRTHEQTIEALRQEKQSVEWHYQAVVTQKDQQLAAIHASRFWRLRTSLARLLGRS